MSLTAPTILGRPFPDNFYKRFNSAFLWEPPTLRRNGNGVAIAAGFQTLRIRWSRLPMIYFGWWTAVVLEGEYSRSGVTFTWWNQNGVHNSNMSTFTGATVYYPTYSRHTRVHFEDVEVEIGGIIAPLPDQIPWTVEFTMIDVDQHPIAAP